MPKAAKNSRSVIKQSVVLPAPAKELYDSYLDPVRHGKIIGAPVKISAKAESEFSAYGGELSGSTLVAIDSSLIVQSWRSSNFYDSDPDSTLILSFTEKDSKSGRIDLVHLDVPEQDYDGVDDGWSTYYWEPWKAYLAGKKK